MRTAFTLSEAAMCRYAFHTYREHFACFTCRKMFRKNPEALVKR